jgi:hypothetical protein
LQLSLEVLETRSLTNIAEAFQSPDTSRVEGVLILSSPLLQTSYPSICCL